jgi:3-hydroxyisobutyrate dehydrogenase
MDTPVSGGVAAAAGGTLAFMCGGSAGAFARAKPILEGMGSVEKIFHAGPAGAGQVAKAANNMLLAVHMIGTSEALAMGEAHGLDPAVLSEIMKASSGNNWSLQVYNPWPDVMEGVPSSNSYQPGFMVDLMVKDLGLACEVAESCGLNNQMGKQAMAAYSDHQGEGNGPRDFSSILEWVKAQ